MIHISSASVFSEVKQRKYCSGLLWSRFAEVFWTTIRFAPSLLSPLSLSLTKLMSHNQHVDCRPSFLSLSYTAFSALHLTLLCTGLVCAIFNSSSTVLSLFPSLCTIAQQEPDFNSAMKKAESWTVFVKSRHQETSFELPSKTESFYSIPLCFCMEPTH